VGGEGAGVSGCWYDVCLGDKLVTMCLHYAAEYGQGRQREASGCEVGGEGVGFGVVTSVWVISW
jgi:hypothetical protein